MDCIEVFLHMWSKYTLINNILNICILMLTVESEVLLGMWSDINKFHNIESCAASRSENVWKK